MDEDRERALEDELPADTVEGHVLTAVPDDHVEGHRLDAGDAADTERD